MKWAKLLFLFFISLLLGYAPELFTYFVALVNPHDLSFITNQVTANECLKSTISSKCAKIYRIDNLDKLRVIYPDLVIGSGIIIYATNYYCDNRDLIAQFDDYINPGRSFDTFITYQTVSMNKNCKSLEIESWGPIEAVRKGQIAGLFVAGNRDAVARVKQVNEFFRSGIYQVFSFCFLFLAAISIFLRKSVPDLAPDEFDYSLSWWIISALSNAAVIQIFLPIASIPQWQNKFGAVVFLVCLFIHYGHGLKLIRQTNYKVYLILFLISAALILNKYFAVFYVNALFIIGLVGLIPALKIGNRALFLISILVTLAALKIQFNWFLPNPMIIYFFVGLVAFEKFIARLKITSSLSQFLSFVSKIRPNQLTSKKTIDDLVSRAKASTEIPYVTILHVHPDGKLEISRFHEAYSAFLIDSIPPVFAHAISLRSEIWHLRVEDDTYLRIVRNSNFSRIQVGNYFSIIPLYDETRLYGAISVTGYSEEHTLEGEKATEQRVIVRILADQIKNLLRSVESNAKNEWTGIANEFLKIPKHIDSVEALQRTAADLAMIARASVFIATLDKETEKFRIVGISGFDPLVQERLTKGAIYAKNENLQGPIALAANKRKAIIVQDVSLLKEVLHENTIEFFQKNDTKSCAGIPIFLEDENTLAGVLWLERRSTEPPITLLAETPLSNIASSIGSSISNMEIQRSLRSFVPEHKYLEFVKNEKVDEIEFGYLIGLDFKGSTKVSLEKGAVFWEAAMKKLYPLFNAISADYGIKLQEFNWDFFIFSIPSEKTDSSNLEKVLSFVKEITPEVERWYDAEMRTVTDANIGKKQKFRVCVSFGDTSRGLKGGEVKNWGFKGAAIASLVKLEDTCKRLDGLIFYDELAIGNLQISSIIRTKDRVVGTGAQIYKNTVEWQDLIKASKRFYPKKKGHIRQMVELDKKLDPIKQILTENTSEYDFYFHDFETGEEIRFGVLKRFPFASCFKLAVLSCILEYGGTDFLDPAIEIDCDSVINFASGPLNHLMGPVALTVDNFLRLMIDFSDGIATDTLISAIGFERLKLFIKKNTKDSEINSNIRNLIAPLVARAIVLGNTPEPNRDNYLAALKDTILLTDYTNAKDLSLLVERTYSDPTAKVYLRGEQSNPRSSAYLPTDIRILGKTGTLVFFAAVNDCGVIEKNRRSKASFGIATLGWKKARFEIEHIFGLVGLRMAQLYSNKSPNPSR